MNKLEQEAYDKLLQTHKELKCRIEGVNKMNEEHISACKLINMLSVFLLTMCCHPLFFYEEPYNQYLVVVGVLAYGVSLRWVGSNIDHVVRVR